MNKKLVTSIVVALALAATSATSNAQVATNVVNQTGVAAVIAGTFSAPAATVVKGVNAASTYMSSAVSIASTIKIPYIATDSTTTTSGGLTNKILKTLYATYAYGNAEILKLALNTSNVAGWTLAYTNPWISSASPLNGGAYVGLKTTTSPVSAVNNWFAIALGDNNVFTEDSIATNGVTAKNNYDTSYPMDVKLAAGLSSPNSGFASAGVFTTKANWQRNVQTFGSGASAVKVTNEIYTGVGSGSFSGATDDGNVVP